MKYLRLLLKNLLRNKRRSFLTISSIAVSLFLVATLQTILTELHNPPETPDSALRLVVRQKFSLFNVLPSAHRAKIARIEGVDAVIGSMWFGAVYKDPSNFFASFVVNVDQFFEVHPDLVIADEQKEAFMADRMGVIAGKNLVERFDWKIGDRIFLETSAWPIDGVEVTIRGIYEGGSDEATSMYLHWDYYNEALKARFGEWDFVGTFSVRVASPEEIPRVAEEIDTLFQNSSYPTKSETERAFILGFVSMLGDVQFFITSIVSVVVFTIVLVAANAMAMSIRERVREIGILKALGFRKTQVLLLLFGEAIILSLGGALLGAFGARLIFSSINMALVTGGMIQRFLVTPDTLLLCAGIGLFVGLLSSGFPAWRASRRSVVDALRRVA
jgi:putative ABC transport system permease protein